VPPEYAELVSEGVAAINETYRTGDIAHWRRHVEKVCDPEVVLEGVGETFTEGKWRGHDGVVEFVANQMDVLDSMFSRLDEFTEASDDTFVAVVTFGGRARSSGLDVQMRPTHVYRMRGGKIWLWQIFQSRQQALDSVATQPDESPPV
jgi:ketosteroid isomerase-like protein